MRFVFVLIFFSLSFEALADLKCNVDLKYGIIVNDRQIRVIDESRTLYQINGTDQLIVMGNVIELEPPQQQDLKDISAGLHYVVPKIIILATEGVELAVETVQHVYVGLVGNDHKSYDKLQSSLKRVQMRVKEKFIHANENFFIGPGRLENLDDLVDREIEKQLGRAIDMSVGGILSAISGLEKGSANEPELTQEQLEQAGKEIERKVESKADTLRAKAEWFCNKMHHLDKIEERLRKSVPELRPFDVILAPVKRDS